ncbi:LysR family transcriptional regulator [Alkalicoccobacillus murimartini]|uniref:DNA-binding transcriptional LysR family regulator n=1 Tax=Alkalicoccobacillus murimartini TaxID=171685 RepID=A0ABT9YHK5_9BACI|nr:LysR family transcriptional regulator [Alkalicoccobacillus murimartini]MDQ0207352.1 DNA-binding transcriptional LysR family regulator [Alkalicoccobacillus murimartini]
MDKLDLELFTSLAHDRSMNKLSLTYPLSYSTISKRLELLEEEVGKKLFVRSKSGTEFTLEGRKFYYFAYKSLLILNEGIRIMQDTQEEDNEVFQFGVNNPVMRIVSPIIMPLIEKQGLYKRWKIQVSSSIELPMLTSCEVIQMAIVNQNDYIPDNVKSIELFSEPIHLVGARKNKVYHDLINPSFLMKDACFIIPKRGYPLRELIEEKFFRAYQIRPKQIIEIENFWDIKTLVREGVGYTLLPRSSLWLDTKGLSIYNLHESSLSQCFYLIYPERLEDQQKDMISFVVKGVREQVNYYREQDGLDQKLSHYI